MSKKDTFCDRIRFPGASPKPVRRYEQYLLADLAANGDLAATVIFSPPDDVIIADVLITPDGSSAGVDGSNTSVWTVASAVGTIVTETYDAGTAFPADNVQTSLGTIANAFVKAGGRLDLTVTNGTTANLPPVLVTVVYYLVEETIERGLPDGLVVYRSSTAGNPTITKVDGSQVGELLMALDATNEVQVLTLYAGDTLQYDIDQIRSVAFKVKLNQSTLDSATSIAFGLTGDRNNTIDSIAQALLFRLIGSTAIVVETDDGTTDNDDLATGLTLVDSYVWFEFNLATGKADVRAIVNGQPVVTSTTLSLAGYSGSLQPFVQIQKTADTNTDGVVLEEIVIEGTRPGNIAA